LSRHRCIATSEMQVRLSHPPIHPRQLPGCEDMAFHGLPERGGIHCPGRIHRIVQCPDGQDISMGAALRRTGTGILRFPGTVYSLQFPARQFTVRRDTCRHTPSVHLFAIDTASFYDTFTISSYEPSIVYMSSPSTSPLSSRLKMKESADSGVTKNVSLPSGKSSTVSRGTTDV
jgi:hypothetical protein